MTDSKPTGRKPTPSLRSVVSEDVRLGRAFRRLADEHIATKRRDDAEAIWEQHILPSLAGRGFVLSSSFELGDESDVGPGKMPRGPASQADARGAPSERLYAEGPSAAEPSARGPHFEGPASWDPYSEEKSGARFEPPLRPRLDRPTTATRPLLSSVKEQRGLGRLGFGSRPAERIEVSQPVLGAAHLLRQSPQRRSLGALAKSQFGRLATLAAAAAVALGFGLNLRDGGELSYRVASADGEEIAVDSGLDGQLVATENLEATIDFSDDSQVTLEPHTTLRLEVEDSGRVVSRISQGTVRVQVEHHEETDYRFRTGPYEVQVTGTEFSLSFDPRAMKMSLEMREGRVVVRDPVGGEHVVTGGQRLELPESAIAEEERPDQGQRLDALDGPEVDAADLSAFDEETSSEGAANAPAERASVGNRADFIALAREGKFEAIVAAAHREGMSRVLASRSVSELQELAQAARYTGQTALAVSVFENLAERHAGTAPGRSAPFFLGRIAEERGQNGRALSLYGNYLAGSPRGLYAAEALGRKMNLVQRSRGSEAARPIAEEYIRRFPKGAYHTLARSLVSP